MPKYVFPVSLDGLDIIRDRDTLFDRYFIHGHSEVVVPDFTPSYNQSPVTLPNGVNGHIIDVHDMALEWPGMICGWGLYDDQNGGEFYSDEYELDDDGGITIEYHLYDVSYPDADKRFDDLKFLITGYVFNHPDDYAVMLITSIEIGLTS